MGYLKIMRTCFGFVLMVILMSGNVSAKPDTGLKCSGKLRLVMASNSSTPSKEESNEDIHILLKWVGDEFMALFVNDKMWFLTGQCISHENGLKCETVKETKNTVRHRELSLSSSTGLLEFTELGSLSLGTDKYMQKKEFSGSCAIQKKLF